MIQFNKYCKTGTELTYIEECLSSDKISGDGMYTAKCKNWFEAKLGSKVLLTPSCTAALEMAALLADIGPGDEVIMPSYTFVSTANAFVLRGAKIVFVDIRPDTMNIDENKIEEAITEKTKAIVPVHYAGVACEMNSIMKIADKWNLIVIEDAAQGMMSTYEGKPLGTIGHIGAYSFHETKNYTSGGEGGLLIINDDSYKERAEIIREKGTNRSLFFRGQVDKYTWTDVGSSYLPSELQAAYLYGQLLKSKEINDSRLKVWHYYHNAFKDLAESGKVNIPYVSPKCEHNAHMFYLKLKDLEERSEFISIMKSNNVSCVFHYIPLHSSPAGKRFGEFYGEDEYTSIESEKLVRLPIYYGMEKKDYVRVAELALSFFG